jgi:acyl carrier protein
MPLSEGAIEERVRAAVARVAGREQGLDAMDLDSLEAVELALALEEDLGIRAPDGWMPRTLADVIAMARSTPTAGGEPLAPGIGPPAVAG